MKKIIKNITIITIITFITFFSFSQKAQAALWPGVDPMIAQGLTEVYNQIQGTMLALQKTQAALMLTKQVFGMIGGNGTNGAMFITNWQSYLINDPTTQANRYINDYISQITAGRGSLTSYEGFSSGGYMAQMTQMAKNSTSEQQTPQVTYQGDPSQMFAPGNFKNMQLYLSGVNNPWALDAQVSTEYQQKIANLRQIAAIQATAYQGFKGLTTMGPGGIPIVTNPGSLIAAAAANAQNIGNNIIASATHTQELITSVVSLINSQAFQDGLGQIQYQVAKQLGIETKYNSLNTNPADYYQGNGPIGQIP